jgi:peptidyl-tRNA hydrolase, PTH1 family
VTGAKRSPQYCGLGGCGLNGEQYIACFCIGTFTLSDHSISLIIGLGNPGKEYEKTRHNAGKWFADQVCDLYRCSWTPEKKFHGWVSSFSESGQKVYVLFPTTFMNRSGISVAALCQFYQISPQNILVAHDELDLPVGKAKLKIGGGHGGHNGLRSMIDSLGKQANFARLRIGIGHPGDKNKVSDYVLSNPSVSDQIHINQSIERSCALIKEILSGKMSVAMNQLNSN